MKYTIEIFRHDDDNGTHAFVDLHRMQKVHWWSRRKRRRHCGVHREPTALELPIIADGKCIAGVENEPHQLTEAIVLKVLMVSVDARLRARHA
jgi:hypothetical protein